jgi:hypothetical protein
MLPKQSTEFNGTVYWAESWAAMPAIFVHLTMAENPPTLPPTATTT